jgi:putative FmdB family regulatory protein
VQAAIPHQKARTEISPWVVTVPPSRRAAVSELAAVGSLLLRVGVEADSVKARRPPETYTAGAAGSLSRLVPIYEYRCPNGHTFELFQRMSDPPPERCEVCGEAPLERVLYPVAVHFKGSGFYSTDYGRGGKKRESSGSKEGGDSSSSSDGGSGEKPASEPKKAAEA